VKKFGKKRGKKSVYNQGEAGKKIPTLKKMTIVLAYTKVEKAGRIQSQRGERSKEEYAV